MKSCGKLIGVLILSLALICPQAYGGASQKYHARPFSLKDSISGQRLFGYSLIAPGFGQLYNKSYFKAALAYTGMAAGIYGATRFDDNKTNRNLSIALAGASYMFSLLDAQASFRYKEYDHSPTKATVYAALVPGLGQIYNQKYWKLPIVYGGVTSLVYFYQRNDFRYNYFRDGYNNTMALQKLEANKDQMTETDYNAQKAVLVSKLGSLNGRSSETLRMYKNSYRRDRDFVVILSGLFYIMTIMDANVDAHFFDYDISNNLSFNIQPQISTQQIASRQSGFGLSLNVTF